MAAAKSAPDAAPAQALGEQVEAWMVQLEQAPAVTPQQLAQGLQAAAWRALSAALSGDAAKAPAAAAAAVEAAQAAAAMLAPDDDSPVTEAELVTSLRRAVRRGLASDDPRRVAEAVALWAAERGRVDPDGAGAAGGAEDAALAAEVAAARVRAREQADAMAAAGEVGR
jgi:hypothetical protein